jgi:phage-related protein
MTMSKAQPKPLIWLGNSLDAVKSFSVEARKEAGHELGQVQEGREPSDWKPMETVGAGVKEIRIKVETAYRVLYVAKFAEAVYVLHGFEKKTQKTPKTAIDLANERYRKLVNERKKR